MNLVNLIDYLRDRLKIIIRISYAVLAMLVFIDATCVDKAHAHTAIEHVPGFWSAFGFIACVLIIILSKWFGHQGIMTREDYYD